MNKIPQKLLYIQFHQKVRKTYLKYNISFYIGLKARVRNTSHVHMWQSLSKKVSLLCTGLCRHISGICTEQQASSLLFTLNSHPSSLTWVILILHVPVDSAPKMQTSRPAKCELPQRYKLKILPQRISISLLWQKWEICTINRVIKNSGRCRIYFLHCAL